MTAQHPLLAARRSPRALDPAAEVSTQTLAGLLEAARWAPSYGNTQPARFVVGRRGDPTFTALVATLTRGNSRWAPAAGALLLGVARTANEKGPLSHAAFDLGAAVMALQLQAVAEGLVAHPMGGFDAAAARGAFTIPAGFDPLVLVAVGRLAAPGTVGPDIAEHDARPRARLPLVETAFTGRWGEPFLPALP